MLEGLEASGERASYHLLPAARAEILRRLGRAQAAGAEYRRAWARHERRREALISNGDWRRWRAA
jgi:predicted RNA polymerase sigma factor